ncbi:MAG: hypothetical protein PHR35_18685 [Kiritimatiellae bacterium]|nr:hypothetical protein [Kiritimatiellia bacterium]
MTDSSVSQPRSVNRELRQLALAGALVVALIVDAGAGDYIFKVPSGDWNVPANWNPAGVPSLAGDTAHIYTPGATAIVSGAQSVGNLRLGYRSYNGTLDIQATGGLDVSDKCYIPYSDIDNQTATGTVHVAGKLASPTIYLGMGSGFTVGRIVQSGGVVTSSTAFIMGYWPSSRGYFEQNGGTNVFQSLELAVHNNVYGSYTINNGSLTTPKLVVGASFLPGVGGTGVFTMAGSADVVAAELVVGSKQGLNGGANKGVLNVNGGKLAASTITVGYIPSDDGRVIQSGGTVTSSAAFTMAWNGNTVAYYEQNGGTNTFASMEVTHHNSRGTYTITGGSLTTPALVIGASVLPPTTGTGVLNVAGSAKVTASALTVGSTQGSNRGFLNVSGGEIHATALTVAANNTGNAIRLTLPRTGLNPIEVANTATLNGVLTIERATNYRFEPNSVITAMTYSARSGAFAQTNLLGGMTCRVNYDVDVGGGRKAITLDQLRPLPQGTIIQIR